MSPLAALGLALALVAPAQAQAPDTVVLEELTWTELRAFVRAGKTTILLPIGGTEQNGPHMALGKHNARVKALAERIAKNLGNALVAPVLSYVPEGSVQPPTGHMRFPAPSPSAKRRFARRWIRRRAAFARTASATSSSSAITARPRPASARSPLA